VGCTGLVPLRVLVVDDDSLLRSSLRRGFFVSGCVVSVADDRTSGLAVARREILDAAVVDLRLGNESGLELIDSIRAIQPQVKVVVVSGYLSVDLTVSAVQRGAAHVLLKPVTHREILRRLTGQPDDKLEPEAMPSLARAEWEYMMRVVADCGGNISEASRRLGLHRQNLQRRLRKNPPVR